jgi:YhcH/YjgK/YiaL family protein
MNRMGADSQLPKIGVKRLLAKREDYFLAQLRLSHMDATPAVCEPSLPNSPLLEARLATAPHLGTRPSLNSRRDQAGGLLSAPHNRTRDSLYPGVCGVSMPQMFFSRLSDSAQWESFLTQPIFQKSLSWISANLGSFTDGIHELGEPGWCVNVHGYTTQARDLCAWENHPATIDIQYMIEGIEAIDVIASEKLGAPTSYKAESDTEKFGLSDEPATQLVLRSGEFVIFLPGEAHRPKVQASEPAALRKLVVKIPVKLLESVG